MNEEDFKTIYSKCVSIQNNRLQSGDKFYTDFYGNANLPAIVGFGLPDGEEIEIATIGINPSGREFQKVCVPSDIDQSIQWKGQRDYFLKNTLLNNEKYNPYRDWFNYSSGVLEGMGGLSYGGVYPGEKNAVHLDYSPYATKIGMIRYYNQLSKKVDEEDKEKERKRRKLLVEQTLSEDLDNILFEIIENLIEFNKLRTILIFGYVPLEDVYDEGDLLDKQKGNALQYKVSKNLGIFSLSNYDRVDCNNPDEKIKIGEGTISKFENLKVIYFSKGPSYPMNNSGTLEISDFICAGKLCRERNWI
jgi:hypothetical protein